MKEKPDSQRNINSEIKKVKIKPQALAQPPEKSAWICSQLGKPRGTTK